MPSGAVLAVGLLFLIAYIVGIYRKPKKTLPPGPSGIPILGNLLDIPTRNAWLRYQELGRQYGTLLSSDRILPFLILQ